MTDQTILHDFFSDMWLLVLVRGIAAVLLGVLLISQPLVTISLLVLFMGAYWLVDGIMLVISSIRGRKHTKGWGMGLFFGALSALAGVFVMGAPAIAAVFTATFLIYLLAFAAITSGTSNIVSGIRLRKEIDNEWAMVLGGVLWVLLGFSLLSQPIVGIVTAVYFIAGISIVGGVVLIYLAWKARAVAIRMADAT